MVESVEIEIQKDVYLPCYQHLLGSDADINFLWGGRDSGKSHFIAQYMIELCLSMPYFRCILIKKTFESIKDAQWQTLKDIVHEWGLDDFFQFKTSPLEIVCVNGNKFICRGCDKPGKLKSIKDPSHAWYEEGNQLTEDDYITASTTLRGKPGTKVQEWFSFNPESPSGKPDKFWLYKTFFGERAHETNFSADINTTLVTGEVVTLRYTSTHTTYFQNPFCSAERIAKLESMRIRSPYYYDVFCLGKWGTRLTGQEMFTGAWNRAVHIRSVQVDYDKPIHLWFDFNRIPYMTCLVVQVHRLEENGQSIQEVRVLDEICPAPPHNSVEHIERTFTLKYGKCRSMFFSGDRTGNNNNAQKTIDESLSMYHQVEKSFRKYLHNSSNMVPNVNPPLAGRKQALWDILGGTKRIRVVFDPKCVHCIDDFEMAVEDVNNSWLKKKEKDEALGKLVESIGHALDAFTCGMSSLFRYLFYP